MSTRASARTVRRQRQRRLLRRGGGRDVERGLQRLQRRKQKQFSRRRKFLIVRVLDKTVAASHSW